MSQAAEKIVVKSAITLSVERAQLLNALGRVQSIVEKRNTIPILSNIRLTTKGNTLELAATDMDILALETIQASVGQEGSLTVPAQTFYDIVRKLSDGVMIAIDTDPAKGQVTVEAGGAKFRLSYLPSEDFPVVAEGQLDVQFTLTAAECFKLIEKTRFAMSMEETRYYLNGIYLHAAEDATLGKVLRAVATDGHRLALHQLPAPKGAASMPGIIIPRKAANEISRILTTAASDVQISLSDSKIKFVIGDVILISKLIDGTFPDYQRVIPSREKNTRLLEVDHSLLAEVIDRVSTISNEKTKSVKFAIDKKKLTLSSQSPESGTAKEQIDVNYASDPIEIGFNAKYVMEMLSQLEGEICHFLLSDATGPALVESPASKNALYVVMPMRV